MNPTVIQRILIFNEPFEKIIIAKPNNPTTCLSQTHFTNRADTLFTQKTLRWVRRGREQHYIATSKLHRGQGETVHSRQARDGLSSSFFGCVPTTLLDSEDYWDDQRLQPHRFRCS